MFHFVRRERNEELNMAGGLKGTLRSAPFIRTYRGAAAGACKI
jgi:hypothetical protein